MQKINFLHNYVLGSQKIQYKKKDVRPEINNKVVENHALEIVDFKVSHFLSDPITYVGSGDASDKASEISEIYKNAMAAGKERVDYETARWMHTCGAGYKCVLPDKDAGRVPGKPPFELYSLDPRKSFVAYYNDSLSERPVVGGIVTRMQDGTMRYTLYTAKESFVIATSVGDSEKRLVSCTPNPLTNGEVPIVEFPANDDRYGAFEPVIDLLDAINEVQSNRLDGVEQFIQAYLLLHNVSLSTETFEEFRKLGCLEYADSDPTRPGEIKYVVSELNQSQTQALVDDLYSKVLTILGMPNRNGGSSTSDTGKATLYRDGWVNADGRTASTEKCWADSERRVLSLMIGASNADGKCKISPNDVAISFTARNHSNTGEKVNALVAMLGCDRIAPALAFEKCDLFDDPEHAAQISEEHYNKQKKEELALAKANQIGSNNDPGNGRNSFQREAPGNGSAKREADSVGAGKQNKTRTVASNSKK